MIQNTRLSSGLELVHHSIPHTKFVDIALGIGVGSRYETAHLAGISHFIEHMLFRGCKRLPTSYELNVAFDRIGDGLNAMTYKEFTLFTTKVPVEQFSLALELMCEVLAHPLFEGVDTERGIILEELLEELDEKGKQSDIENILRAKTFGKHALGRPVLGQTRTVKRITSSDLRDFHSKFYVPSNMVLSVAGGVPWNQCQRAAEMAFSRFDLVDHDIAPAEPVGVLKPGVHFVEGKGSQVQALLSFFMPGEQTPGELSRLFISRLLDDGISSRLQRTVCERRGLLYDISCGIESMTDVALFDIQFSVSPGKLLEVVDLVLKELKLLKAEPVSNEEFETVRGRFTRDIYETSESSRSMANLMAEAFLLKLPMPIDSAEYRARLGELTHEAVQLEAKAAFQPKQCAFIAKGKISAKQKTEIKKLIRSL